MRRGNWRGRGGFQRGRGRGVATYNTDPHIERVVSTLSTHCKDVATKDSRIYVGNISKEASRADVYAHFMNYGNITAISELRSKYPRDNNYAFVQFVSPESAETAVLREDGAELLGLKLTLKLAEFSKESHSQNLKQNTNHQSLPSASVQMSRPIAVEQPKNSSVAQTGGAFIAHKRNTTAKPAFAPPKQKKARMETGDNPGPRVPDILVCGTCHSTFPNMENMINHKRRPCKPKLQCRCVEDNVPEVMTCAICQREWATPWQLIEHIHRDHQLVICSNINGEVSNRDADLLEEHTLTTPKTEEYDEDENEYDEEVDLDNDLMDDEDGVSHYN